MSEAEREREREREGTSPNDLNLALHLFVYQAAHCSLVSESSSWRLRLRLTGLLSSIGFVSAAVFWNDKFET